MLASLQINQFTGIYRSLFLDECFFFFNVTQIFFVSYEIWNRQNKVSSSCSNHTEKGKILYMANFCKEIFFYQYPQSINKVNSSSILML